MGEAVLRLAKVAFIERWPSYGVATINRFHCNEVFIHLTMHTQVYNHDMSQCWQPGIMHGSTIIIFCAPQVKGRRGIRG